MKTRLLLILSFLFLIVRGLFAWNGSGSSGDPYQITSIADWNTLATSVSGGTNYSGQFFKLTKNISVTTMISGTFSGTFDGNGHTLTVILSGGGNRAPFQYLNGGTIKGLTVAGTVTASANYSSGLVARATGGTCLIDNCVVNANITGVGYIGGILAYNDGATSMTITNCIYGGTISITPDSEGANYTGGIFGWYNKTDGSLNLTIHNCLCKGTYTGNGQFHPIGVKKNAATFASKSCTNCFYTANPQNASGGRIFTDGTKCCKLTIGTDGVSIASGSTCTFQGTTYHYGAITLAYDHADATVVYTVGGTSISGNSFTINTGTAFTSGAATITADVTYDITYDLDGGSLNASQQTYTNPTTYKPTDAAITLRNPHKDGYAFYGWTGTNVGSTRRAQVNVTIPSGSLGDRSYTAVFQEYTEGPWHFEGIQTGICTTDINPTFSYNGMIYNTIWMNPYPWQDNSGFGFTEWGTSATSGNKYGLYSIFTTNQQIPSYTRKVLHWNYDIESYADKFHQTVALYVHDNLETLKNAAVDMTADYKNQTHGAATYIGHYNQTTTSPADQPRTGLTHDFEFDNRTGTSEQTLSKAMLMTQVIESTSSTPVEMHHWGGFKNQGMTWDIYYYKYVTFDANGGTGTAMAQLDVENSGTLTANSF
ncbi:MAG: InlB B-repeat-containing protein, partial [Paludibacteraceae bacterium]|nr:InlB B-repeat-containing protein [Paludibacteraceae bacterium]